MSEALMKRLAKVEAKLNSQPQGTFDVVRFIMETRLERDRLMKLSQSEYEKEMEKLPCSKENQIARVAVAYQKRFDAMTPEDQQRILGYAGFPPLEYAKIRLENAQRLASPKNWVTDLMAERAKGLRTRS